MPDDDLWPLLISERAGREIAEAQEWWLENREKAPQALEEELRTTFKLLLETPQIGALVPTRKRKFMRRVFLARTGYYVYYLHRVIICLTQQE
jgi:plasmid stabilization system protein ParE